MATVNVHQHLGKDHIEITTTSGQVYKGECTEALGHPNNPMTVEQGRAKFHDCMKLATNPLPAAQCKSIIDVVEHLSKSVGVVVVVLGIMHFINLVVLNALRTSAQAARPPGQHGGDEVEEGRAPAAEPQRAGISVQSHRALFDDADPVTGERHCHAIVIEPVVVIAEHGHRAPIDQFHHRPRRPLRIGAVADIVSQQHEPLGAAMARLGKAGCEGLPVGVDV